MKGQPTLKKWVVVMSLVITGTGSTLAEASPPLHVHGTYAYTGEGGCLYSPSGFDPVTLTPNGFSFTSSFSVIGTWTWQGNGLSTLTGTVKSITHPAPADGFTFVPGASTVDIQAQFMSAAVGEDGAFTADMVPGSFLGTFLSGTRAGQTFTFDTAQLTGYVDRVNRDNIDVATTSPAIETQTIYDTEGQVTKVLQRICHGSRTLTKISE